MSSAYEMKMFSDESGLFEKVRFQKLSKNAECSDFLKMGVPIFKGT